MADWLDISDISGWSAFGGLGILVIVSMWRGWVLPKSQVDRIVTLMLEQKRDADKQGAEWKSAYQAEAKTSATLARQNDELLEGARTTHHIVDSLPRTAGETK